MDKKTFIIGLLIGLICLLGLIEYYHCNNEEVRRDTTKVHVTVWDTILYYAPKYRDSVVVKYVTKVLPVAEPHGETCGTVADAQQAEPRDSVSVEIPITQKMYTDDSTYKAYVSGYEPNLDSIFVYNKTITNKITITETRTKTKDYPLGVGITAGAGYGFIHKQPDVFVGLSVYYRLWPQSRKGKK